MWKKDSRCVLILENKEANHSMSLIYILLVSRPQTHIPENKTSVGTNAKTYCDSVFISQGTISTQRHTS